jgi:hypothetical protein
MKRSWILLLVLCLSIAGPAAVGADGMTVFLPLVVRSEPPGSRVVVNGSFEAGRTGWMEYQDPFLDFPLIVRDDELPAAIDPYDGVWAAWLGGDSEWSAWIEQEVTLPGTGPVLVYWHWIDSKFDCDASSYGGVVLDDTWVDAYELCAATDTGGWVKRTVDLSGFAGETVWLRIASVTGVGNYSSLFIDAVSIDG